MMKVGDSIPGGDIVGSIADSVLTPLHSLRDTIQRALSGQASSGASTGDVEAILAAQNAALVGAQSQLARYEGIFTSGVAVADLFEFATSAGAGPNFAVSYSGSTSGNVYVDGHNLAWNAAPLTAATRRAVGRWLGNAEKPATTATGLQYVELVLNSIPENPIIGTPGYNGVLLRCNEAMTDYLELRFRGDNVILLYRVVSNTFTLMNQWSMPFPYAVGSRLGCKAGKPGTNRFFIPMVNGFPLEGFAEAGTASMNDSSHQGLGWSMFAGAKTDLILIPAQAKPGSVKQWTGQDQVSA
jgi:hypothetical protein